MKTMKTISQYFLSLVVAGMCVVTLTLPLPATAATTNVVVVGGIGTFAFNPKVVSIQAGDKVIWTGLGAIHSVTGDTPPETLCGISLPGSCTNIFNTPGSYLYHCFNHSLTMTGRVDVLPPVAVPAVLTNAFMSNGNFQFTVISVAHRTNVIQATTNVASTSSWSSIATLVPTTNIFNFTDSNANLFPIRIYRVVEP